MPHPRTITTALAALALAACGGPPVPPLGGQAAATQVAPPSSLLRLPRDGGVPSLHQPRSLSEIPWRISGRLPPLRRAVGADLDQRLAFASDSTGAVVAIDLEGGKVRPLLPKMLETVVGPDGTLYAVDPDLRVTRVSHRRPSATRATLAARPAALFGTAHRRLLAIVPQDTARLAIIDGDRPIVRIALPDGQVTASLWGDLMAVAADSAVVLYEPLSAKGPQALDVPRGARSVVFSPSAHRLYATRTKPGITVVDRFRERVIGTLEVPGPVAALRPDRYGGWLLARPAEGDSIWVVDLSTGGLAGAVRGAWGEDLPTVVAGRTLVVRRGADVMTYDLAEPGLPETGRQAGGAKDYWMALAWIPEGAKPEAAPEAGLPAEAQALSGEVYLQVSSSRNPSWANDFLRQLREAGLEASILDPRPGEDAYRVVLGPYASREEAEEVARQLGRPSFIYQPRERVPE